MVPLVRLLGPLGVEVDGSAVVLPSRQARTVLAVLALRSPVIVSIEELVDIVWIGRPPKSAATKVHGHISTLRRIMGCQSSRHPHQRCPISTEQSGYRLDAAELDLTLFRTHVAEAARPRASGEGVDAAQHLMEALAQWRGHPCSNVAADAVEAHASALVEVYLDAVEDFAEVGAELGLHRQVIGLLRPLILAHPYRERLLG